jgi:hypothetical protein
MTEEGQMSGGEAFVILAAADIAVRERRARSSRSAGAEWSPFFGSMYRIPRPVAHSGSTGSEGSRGGSAVTRSWIEILVAVGAVVIILLMVALGGIAADGVASAAVPEPGMTVGAPDPLTTCRSVNGQSICVREPT